jgi:transcription antitermination factor NusG
MENDEQAFKDNFFRVLTESQKAQYLEKQLKRMKMSKLQLMSYVFVKLTKHAFCGVFLS